MTPELGRTLPVDRLGGGALAFDVVATDAEGAAVAARLRIPAVPALACRFRLTRDGADPDVVAAEGELAATVVQVCVVTLEPFEQAVAERFRLRFVPEGRPATDDDPDSDDEIPYAGTALDLGEATVQQLALSLDPFPRAPGATLPALDDDAPVSPFAALVARRR